MVVRTPFYCLNAQKDNAGETHLVDLTQTIPGMAARAAEQFGTHPALEEDGVTLSFAELYVEAQRSAKAFLAHGLEKGDRFAVWSPNAREWILAALGGMMAGGVLVPINTRFKGGEAGDIMRRSRARLLFTAKGFLGFDYPAMLEGEDLPDLERTILLRGAEGETFAEFVQSGAAQSDDALSERLATIGPDDLSDIIFTSGTTGRPKGAMTAHGQNVAAVTAWCKAVGVDDTDRYLIVNPFFHSFGYKAGWLACIITGACALPHAVFDVDQILKRISDDRISVLPGPPTIFQSLINHPALAEADISNLKKTVTGAASVPVELVKQMKEVLGFESVLTAYGLTESCGFVSLTVASDDFETIATTSGKAMSGVEVKLVDESGNKVEPGAPGEILVRGFNVMRGYLDDPDATAEAIDAEGWLHTGDIGVQNSKGYLAITDRAKDMFITGGFNCYPAEIESALLRHELVVDAAVIGAPDERMGEVGHAFVVIKPGEALAGEDLIGWARGQMANYKVPRFVTIVDELPRNASGKVQKFKLRNSA